MPVLFISLRQGVPEAWGKGGKKEGGKKRRGNRGLITRPALFFLQRRFLEREKREKGTLETVKKKSDRESVAAKP